MEAVSVSELAMSDYDGPCADSVYAGFGYSWAAAWVIVRVVILVMLLVAIGYSCSCADLGVVFGCYWSVADLASVAGADGWMSDVGLYEDGVATAGGGFVLVVALTLMSGSLVSSVSSASAPAVSSSVSCMCVSMTRSAVVAAPVSVLLLAWVGLGLDVDANTADATSGCGGDVVSVDRNGDGWADAVDSVRA